MTKEKSILFVKALMSYPIIISSPIHARKLMSKSNKDHFSVECEDQSCMDFVNVEWKSGIATAKCRHLQEAVNNPYFPIRYKFLDTSFHDLSANRSHECREKNFQAEKANANTIVAVENGARFIHFSVFD